MTTLDNLLKLVGTPRDGALLRFSLGNEYLKAGEAALAAAQFRAAVEKDPKYSAAWKLLGKSLAEAGQAEAALAAYREGIAVAEAKGDLQAAKEMTVFARRLERDLTLLARRDLPGRDVADSELGRALIGVTAELTVYRTYVRRGEAPGIDDTLVLDHMIRR